MTRFRPSILALLCSLSLAFAALAAAPQQVPPTGAGKAEAAQAAPKVEDHSKEAFVLEQVLSTWQFENDGTARKQFSIRARVQSESGVQQFGQIIQGYNSANERMDVDYVRVRKADGRVVTAAPDAVQDLSGPLAQEAPVYTDYRQKHITVPALRPGEIVEFQVTTTTHTALAPGQFWGEYTFTRPGGPIVLSEKLEVSVPAARALKLKSTEGHAPAVAEENGRRIYRWESSHTVRETDEELQKQREARAKITSDPEPPDVQLTTFPDWQAVGRWYSTLERDRRAPSAEIKRRAAALSAGVASGAAVDKVERLYDFVAKNFRYVSLSFGLGRYQPHAAAEILANQYGDCKDKHTLLASLLAAEGFEDSSVLIGSTRSLDPEVPSPSQFDHVIDLVTVGDRQIWLDTTTEVAPFRVLAATLRGKQALVIAPDASARLAETPADLPFTGTDSIDMQGTITPLGALDLRFVSVNRGDDELSYRLGFRRVPQARWKELLDYMVQSRGYEGTVADIEASDPASTRDPFRYAFRVPLSGYFNWTSRQQTLVLPFGSVSLPDGVGKESRDTIKLRGPKDASIRIRLELPEGIKARLPVPMTLTRDYAEYTSRYSLEGRTLVAERKLSFKQRELSPARATDYAAFRRAIEQDEEQGVTLDNPAPGAPAIPETAKAEELYDAGRKAYSNGENKTAVDLFRRVVALEPKHKEAWLSLSAVYLDLEQYDKAIDACRKQIDNDAFDGSAYNNLGLAFYGQRKFDEAEAAYKKQIEVNPLDRYAHGNLGRLYTERKRYQEAVDELEKAAGIAKDDGGAQATLGQAYLNVDRTPEALAAFDRAVQLSPRPITWNNIAYYLTLKKVALDRARQYAESAVAATSANLRNLTADTMASPQADVSLLASSWDTLGWVRYQQGDLDAAEELIESAWRLQEHGEVGDHLGQIYEKRGDRRRAMATYALALAAYRPEDDTRPRLAALAGGDGKVGALVEKAKGDLKLARTTDLGKSPLAEDATASFKLLLASSGSVEAVKFIEGSEKLRTLEDRLRTLRCNLTFPKGAPTRVVVDGTVTCTAKGCSFVREVRPQS